MVVYLYILIYQFWFNNLTSKHIFTYMTMSLFSEYILPSVIKYRMQEVLWMKWITSFSVWVECELGDTLGRGKSISGNLFLTIPLSSHEFIEKFIWPKFFLFFFHLRWVWFLGDSLARGKAISGRPTLSNNTTFKSWIYWEILVGENCCFCFHLGWVWVRW